MTYTSLARQTLVLVTAAIVSACVETAEINSSGPTKIETAPSSSPVQMEISMFDTRKSDLGILNTALQQYYSDNGAYPKTEGGNWASIIHTADVESDAWLPNLVPKYLKKTPVDPSGNADPNAPHYFYKSNGLGYKLISHKSGDCLSLSPEDEAKPDPKRSGGGRCWAWGYFTPDFASL